MTESRVEDEELARLVSAPASIEGVPTDDAEFPQVVEAYLQAQRIRTLLRAGLAATFREVDLLLTPTTPCAATLVGQTEIEFEGAVVTPRQMLGYATQPFSLGGVPALFLPLGQTDGGLPFGLQVVGPALGGALVLRFGQAAERVLRGPSAGPIS